MAAIERVLLYVGAPKTGTTSVQMFLRNNRDALADQGIYSPMAGRATTGQHIDLPTIIPSQRSRGRLERHANVWDDDYLGRQRQFLEELNAEIAQIGAIRTLLLSSEYLFSANRPEVRAYRGIFDGITGRLDSVMYLRRQDQWLASVTLQARKSGSRSDLELKPGASNAYAESVRAWDSLSDKCYIRRLESASLKNGSLLEDFCEIIEADTAGLDMTEVRANPAILQEQVELVDALNPKIELYRFQVQILHRSRFVMLCNEVLPGKPIGFRRADAIRTFESYKAINRWLRETRDPTGPECFFTVDFSGYEEAPDNSRRYDEGQLRALLEAIARASEDRGLGRADPPAATASRVELIDNLVQAFVRLRHDELKERRQLRYTAASEAGLPTPRWGPRPGYGPPGDQDGAAKDHAEV